MKLRDEEGLNTHSPAVMKVAFLGFSITNMRALNVYFSNHINRRFSVGMAENSAVHVVDLEGFLANESYERHIRKYRDVSFVKVSNSQSSGSKYCLPRPLKLHKLMKLLDEIAETRLKPPETVPAAVVRDHLRLVEDLDSDQNKGSSNDLEQQAKHLRTLADQHEDANFWGVRWNTLAGRNVEESYDQQYYLQGLAIKAHRQSMQLNQPVRLDFGQHTIIFLPQARSVVLKCEGTGLQFACLQKMRVGESPELGGYAIAPEFRPESFWLNNAEHVRKELDCVLWDLALWSSRGRMPNCLDPDVPYRLKRWPNFTRLRSQDYMLCLAAVMSSRPISVNELSRKLDLPTGFICQFMSGVQALGLLDSGVGAGVNQRPWQDEQDEKTNLLSRLFKRLSGEQKYARAAAT